MPTITLSRDHPDRWEFTAEDLPGPVTKVTISPAGLYVEAGRLRWDLIPWPELAALIDDGPGAHQSARMAKERQALMQRILAMPGVVAMAGPMPPPEPAEMW